MAIFLKACINGSRAAGSHPALPTTAQMIARDAQACIMAGANAIHFHVRNEQGGESLAAEDVARCLNACRDLLPTAQFGISTGDWIVPDTDERIQAIQGWTVLPDFVSVNFHEDGAEQIACSLHDRGVGIELGLTFPFSTEIALTEGWGERCLRVLLEPMEEDTAAALVSVEKIERLLDEAKVSVPRLLHGSDDTAWTLLTEAAKWGYQCRIGLEDTLLLPTGDQAQNNAQIIQVARALIAEGTS
ncbi:MAG TPA: 3-keto-5-aminohexanoate cleavage protein [Phototrophicaceae bacterium]|nr:3-keto-5-aminohexanoate cleavage protein [Phototrophicaceae bacterium]